MNLFAIKKATNLAGNNCELVGYHPNSQYPDVAVKYATLEGNTIGCLYSALKKWDVTHVTRPYESTPMPIALWYLKQVRFQSLLRKG